MEAVLNFLVSFLALLYNKAANYMQNLGRHAVAVAGVCLVLLIISGLASMSPLLGWLAMLCWMLIGLALASLFVFALPALLIVKEATERSASLRWAVMLPVMVLFFFTLAGRFFSTVPTYQNPKMIVQAMAIAFLLALVLSFTATLDRKILIGVLLLWLLITTITFVLPETTSKVLGFFSDKELSRGLQKIPRHVDYNPSMRPYDSLTGEPRYWYCAVDNEMYSAPGRCENHQNAVLLAMNDKVWEIQRLSYLVRQEEKKKEEGLRIEEEKRKQEEEATEEKGKQEKLREQELEAVRQEVARLKEEKETQALPLFVPSAPPQSQSAQWPKSASSVTPDGALPKVQEVVIPENTPIRVHLLDDVIMEEEENSMDFDAALARSLIVRGVEAVALGTLARGRIISVSAGGFVGRWTEFKISLYELDDGRNPHSISTDFRVMTANAAKDRVKDAFSSAGKRVLEGVLGIRDYGNPQQIGTRILKLPKGSELSFALLEPFSVVVQSSQ